jgi:NADH-quinone oxidoreductase subunit L
MFRMWFMTFAGEPKDEHVHEHAHESPATMTVPLILLAFFSVTVAWGWPLYDAESSELEHLLHHGQPGSVAAEFGFTFDHRVNDNPHDLAYLKDAKHSERAQAVANHHLAGNLALVVVAIGLAFASALYWYRVMNPADAVEQFPGVHAFLEKKWTFDELYSAALVRPALVVSQWARWFDTHVIDGVLHVAAKVTVLTSLVSGLNDKLVVDGAVNLFATITQGIGNRLRGVQTGYIRSYVLFLVLAALALWVLLSFFLGAPAPAVTK